MCMSGMSRLWTFVIFLGLCQADRANETDTACLLAHRKIGAAAVATEVAVTPPPLSASCMATQLPGQVRLAPLSSGKDAVDRWAESWAEQASLSLLKQMGAIVIKHMFAEVLGEVLAGVFKALFPPRFSKEKAMMRAMMEWTQEYVKVEIEQLIKDTIAGSMCTLERQTKDLMEAIDTLKIKIKEAEEEASRGWRQKDPVFPAKDFSECIVRHTAAKGTAWSIVDYITNSHHRAVLVPEFVAISWAIMSLWHDLYNLRRVEENPWKSKELAIIEVNSSLLGGSLGSQKTLKQMKKEFQNLQKAAKDMMESWKKWRGGYLKVEESYETSGEWPLTYRQVTRTLKDEFTGFERRYKTEQTTNDGWPKDLLSEDWTERFLNFRMDEVFIREFVPMIHSFPYMAKLIPGQENKRLNSDPLPEFIQGPGVSAWLAGTGMEMKFHTMVSWSLADTPVENRGNVHEMAWRKGEYIDQLTFIAQKGTFELPKSDHGGGGGGEQPAVDPPENPCGLDIGYAGDWMTRFTVLNAKGSKMEFKGDGSEEAFFATGAGLCGLYKFDRPYKRSGNFGRSGDTLQFRFQFDPDPELKKHE
ncbi:unnamed protein product [Symbiodinium necroappetens]|uniref:Pesticidal crystal protein N-terminal domain-containing protein n=1 Tax=Symbiodinium necroappetens TaxID=1628268 RepID=A0A812WKY2_9DINO|nr:unnamed protein product [Symbiodinium necroappetens]